MGCSVCGAPLACGARFCSFCGHPVGNVVRLSPLRVRWEWFWVRVILILCRVVGLAPARFVGIVRGIPPRLPRRTGNWETPLAVACFLALAFGFFADHGRLELSVPFLAAYCFGISLVPWGIFYCLVSKRLGVAVNLFCGALLWLSLTVGCVAQILRVSAFPWR